MKHIPAMMMRGGTSKGLVFAATDLPTQPYLRDQILLSAMGSPDPRQIDGVGGGASLTSKVAIVGASDRADADADYLFAQVLTDEARVDTTPNCGNMMAAAACFAVEKGFVPARLGETPVRIFNRNTNSVAHVLVPTPHGEVSYDGDVEICGAPGRGAPILLDFREAVGSKTQTLLPTGRPSEEINGVEVTLIDMATPMVLMPASAFGKTGWETKAALDADKAMLARMEAIRLEAGRRMGLGDVSGKVTPKMALIAPAKGGKGVSSRYFTPKDCHAAHAVTGAVCIAAATVTPGTVAAACALLPREKADGSRSVRIEHPSGFLDVSLIMNLVAGVPQFRRAAVVRTARPLFIGSVIVRAPRAAAVANGAAARREANENCPTPHGDHPDANEAAA